MNDDTNTVQTAGQAASQILGTLALSWDRPITPTPSQESKGNSKPNGQQRQKWLDKWLPLEATHPQIEEARQKIYSVCAAYARTPAHGRTLVIIGENGAGKSRIANHIAFWARAIALKLPMVEHADLGLGAPSVAYALWPDIVDGFKRNEWEIVDDMQKSAMLILDDIGAEHDPSKIGVEKLYILLSRREFKWNIITTNMQPFAWEEKFERRISSRLYRNAEHIDLSKVPDYSTTWMPYKDT